MQKFSKLVGVLVLCGGMISVSFASGLNTAHKKSKGTIGVVCTGPDGRSVTVIATEDSPPDQETLNQFDDCVHGIDFISEKLQTRYNRSENYQTYVRMRNVLNLLGEDSCR
jgi:hypothetical protein